MEFINEFEWNMLFENDGKYNIVYESIKNNWLDVLKYFVEECEINLSNLL